MRRNRGDWRAQVSRHGHTPYRCSMRMALWQRLFLAFAALSGVALAGFAAWQQHSFRRGFMSYLDEATLSRLDATASTRLAAAYLEHGSWDFFRDDPRRFGELGDARLPRGRGDDEPPPGQPGNRRVLNDVDEQPDQRRQEPPNRLRHDHERMDARPSEADGRSSLVLFARDRLDCAARRLRNLRTAPEDEPDRRSEKRLE